VPGARSSPTDTCRFRTAPTARHDGSARPSSDGFPAAGSRSRRRNGLRACRRTADLQEHRPGRHRHLLRAATAIDVGIPGRDAADRPHRAAGWLDPRRDAAEVARAGNAAGRFCFCPVDRGAAASKGRGGSGPPTLGVGRRTSAPDPIRVARFRTGRRRRCARAGPRRRHGLEHAHEPLSRPRARAPR
jgi:hypothetical protein